MTPAEMAQERRDALRQAGEYGRITSGCRHYFGSYRSCAMCGITEEEAGYCR